MVYKKGIKLGGLASVAFKSDRARPHTLAGGNPAQMATALTAIRR